MFGSLKKDSTVPLAGWGGIAGLAALLRRMIPALTRRSAVGGALEHLGSLPLNAHSSLALVRLDKETLLLGITPQGITLLAKGGAVTGSARRMSAKKNASAAGRRAPEEPIRR
jgi:flagellar biogenesis protein FliO